MNNQKIEAEILSASHLENVKWADELCKILGGQHPRVKRQVEACNIILSERRKLIPHEQQ